ITTVSGDPAGEVATLSSDTERLNRGIDALYSTSGASNMAGALARAKDILKQSASSLNREIFIVSDFQANGWSDANALKDSAGKGLENTQVYLCGVPGSAPEKNLALQGLSSDSRPPIAGRKMRVLVKVKNASLGDSTAN